MKKIINNNKWFFIGAILIIIADQGTKWMVVSNLEVGAMWAPWDWLMPYARIVHWWNTGVAFGMLKGFNPVFIGLAFIVSSGIIYFFQSVPKEDKLLRIALTMELGGAIGNLVDRIRWGHVVDFVSVGNFPVFNVADSCITVGVFVLLLGVWLQERRLKRETIEEPGNFSEPVDGSAN